jgi:hypothetical protein
MASPDCFPALSDYWGVRTREPRRLVWARLDWTEHEPSEERKSASKTVSFPAQSNGTVLSGAWRTTNKSPSTKSSRKSVISRYCSLSASPSRAEFRLQMVRYPPFRVSFQITGFWTNPV